MDIKIYQVDAFANHIFEGNPAAVCPLDSWLPDTLMQRIAAENNLSETAFFVEQACIFHIRWFTPAAEVNLCGHATLASAKIIFDELNFSQPQIIFSSKSGKLLVSKQEEYLVMDFPAQLPIACETPEQLKEAFHHAPFQCFKHNDYFLIFSSEADITNAAPDMQLLREVDLRAVCISAAGEHYDFVSRCFAPKYGIDEDPVTGSTFSQLAPYWSNVLNKKTLHAKQISARGGEVNVQDLGDRVLISGKAVKYLSGTLSIDLV
ncbi:Phenazine biosynthesis protein PhzF like [hydrothermal vent metagenome]|uniref:Phenazine biosynthesis protein PhzF like n=1 Tax=hydrothermal vent metagenome TaxID=652676 RepID=A0A3B0XAL4_9ZZZZ